VSTKIGLEEDLKQKKQKINLEEKV